MQIVDIEETEELNCQMKAIIKRKRNGKDTKETVTKDQIECSHVHG
jgi:hypothetical protein